MAASWQVPCWKFEKLQIMPLEFEYLGSSEKSEKNTQILHIQGYNHQNLQGQMASIDRDTGNSNFKLGPDIQARNQSNFW